MKNWHYLGLTGLLLVSSCADINFRSRTNLPSPTLSLLLHEDPSLLNEQHRTSFQRNQEMARSSPNDKIPWAAIARIYFKNGHYGKAIVYAGEVLRRDPYDVEARSIVAVSGLRVSSAAIEGLRRDQLKNTGGVTEERALTDLLRSTLSTEVLVPEGRATKKP